MRLIDIAFQASELFSPKCVSLLSDLFINAVGALIGVFGALAIFRLQLKHDRRKEAKKDAKVVENKLHYFANSVDRIIKVSKVNATHLDEFCKEISENSVTFPKLKVISGLDYKRFTEVINHEEYYQAYITKYDRSSVTVEEYRSIYSFVDYLNAQVEQVYNGYLDALQKYEARRNEYTTLINGTRHACTSFINTVAISEDEKYLKECVKELIDESNQVINDYQAELDELNEVWAKPILDGLLPHFPNNEFIKEIQEALVRCIYIPSEIKFYNLSAKEQFQQVHSKILIAIEGLTNVSDRLDNDYAPLSDPETLEPLSV